MCVCGLCNDTYYRKKHLIFFKSEFGDTRAVTWEDRDINDVNTLFIKKGGTDMGRMGRGGTGWSREGENVIECTYERRFYF